MSAQITGTVKSEQSTPPYRVIKAVFVFTLLATIVSILVLLTTSSDTLENFKIPSVVNFTSTRSVFYGITRSFTENKSGSTVTLSQSTGQHIHWTRNQSTRSTKVEFKDMPDPCSKPRRNTVAEDLLCTKPLEFLTDYKNPCFYDGDVLRCMPYFHLFGICKSGTSDLFKRLYKHPDIIPNKGVLDKETWFWSYSRYTTKKVGNIVVHKTLKDFTNAFRADEIKKAVDSHGYHNKITGHGDPMDIWDRFLDVHIPQNDPKDKELLWTSAFLIRKVNPDVKLLLMLRDPVQRLYSTYFHWGLGKTSSDFHNHVMNALPMWRKCLDEFTMRHCIYDKPLKDKMKVPIYSSFYAFHLKEWLRAFPRQQMLIMRNEDYAKNISGTLKQIFTFLNVSMPGDKLLQEIGSMKHFYVTERKEKAGPMKMETKSLLIELYREPTKELAKFLEDKRFAFEDVSFGHQ